MGERVVVGRATPVAPIDEVGDAGSPPLDYGRGDRAGDAWRWLRPRASAFLDAVVAVGKLIISLAGGLGRIGFALGLGCVLGGLGDCLDGLGTGLGGEGVFWMFVGGILIGLTVRVPLRRADEPDTR